MSEPNPSPELPEVEGLTPEAVEFIMTTATTLSLAVVRMMAAFFGAQSVLCHSKLLQEGLKSASAGALVDARMESGEDPIASMVIRTFHRELLEYLERGDEHFDRILREDT